MTSVEIDFQTMKENKFSKPTESPGLVQAFLELDEGSDDEFLDFQFRLADSNANATLHDREVAENMAEWKASFATLQLKQAQEVAEFALARRREDELRLDRQAKEIVVLRRTLQASKVECDQVKAMCSLLTEEKQRLFEELAHQIEICDSFRESATKLNKSQERMSNENVDLKRSLDESIVTTGRLKHALEEKAAELAAWLGLEGAIPQSLTTLADDDNISLATEDNKAGPVYSVKSEGLGDIQRFEHLAEQDNRFKEGQDVLIFGVEEIIIDTVDGSGDKRPVTESHGSSSNRSGVKDTSIVFEDRVNVTGESGNEVVIGSQESEEVLSLTSKIRELQLRLEELQSSGSFMDEKQLNENALQSNARKSLFQDAVVEVDQVRYLDSCCRLLHPSGKCEEGKELSSTISKSEVEGLDGGVAGEQSAAAERRGTINFDADQLLGAARNSALHEPAVIDCKKLFGSLEDPRNDPEDKFVCVTRDRPWPAGIATVLVESITEELTKLLTVIVKTPNGSCQDVFTDLKTRLNSWSHATTKTLHSKMSENGAVEEWKGLVVDFISQSRQELMGLQQRLCDCESELALMDKLQAECLAASQNIGLLTDEIQKLEAQSFSDHIDREEELNLLKEELEHSRELAVEAQKKAAEDQQIITSLREELGKSEIELENSKQGWVAEQEFIMSCLDAEKEEFGDKEKVSNVEMERMARKLEDLMIRLEENERELGELLIISGNDPDSVLSAKIRRLEQSLEDAKSSAEVLAEEKAQLASQVDQLKVRLSEVEYELHLEKQEHVEMLIQYEVEQGHREASTTSDAGMVNANPSQVEQLLAEKTKQLELIEEAKNFTPSQMQQLTLRARVLTLENNLAVTRQKAVDCEAAIKSQIVKEREKYMDLEAKHTVLQNNFTIVKMELGEAEQKGKREQSIMSNLMVELGIAKEEVLRYEVRLQKLMRQANEDVEIERRKQDEVINSQKQMEWHLCRQLELTEGLEREKAKIREVLVDYEVQNLALQKEADNLRTAYMQLARQADQKGV